MEFLKITGLLVIFFFIVAPALTFLHELGHSIVPLAKGEQVHVTVGGYQGASIVLGGLTVSYAGPWMPWVGYTKWSGERDILRLALGPFVSLCFLILSYLLLSLSSSQYYDVLLKLVLYWSLGAFIFTAFPFSYPAFLLKNPTEESDGKQIVEIIRSGR